MRRIGGRLRRRGRSRVLPRLPPCQHRRLHLPRQQRRQLLPSHSASRRHPQRLRRLPLDLQSRQHRRQHPHSHYPLLLLVLLRPSQLRQQHRPCPKHPRLPSPSPARRSRRMMARQDQRASYCRASQRSVSRRAAFSGHLVVKMQTMGTTMMTREKKRATRIMRKGMTMVKATGKMGTEMRRRMKQRSKMKQKRAS